MPLQTDLGAAAAQPPYGGAVPWNPITPASAARLFNVRTRPVYDTATLNAVHLLFPEQALCVLSAGLSDTWQTAWRQPTPRPTMGWHPAFAQCQPIHCERDARTWQWVRVVVDCYGGT